MTKQRNPLELANNIHGVMRRTRKKQISKKCIFVMNSMVNHAIAEAMRTADIIAKTNGKKTITSKVMKSAIDMVTETTMIPRSKLDEIAHVKDEDVRDKIRRYQKVFLAHKKGREIPVMGIRLGRARSVMKKHSCMKISIESQALMVMYFRALVDDLFDIMDTVVDDKKKRYDVRHIQAGLWHHPLAYMKSLYHGTFLTSKPLVTKKTHEDGTLKPKRVRGVGVGKGTASGKRKGKGKRKRSAAYESGLDDSAGEESVFEGFSEDEEDDFDI